MKKFQKMNVLKMKYIKKNNVYDSYYCKKDINISKIEKLMIVIDKIKYRIEFTYDDLFSENGDYLYFNVLFTQEEYVYKNDFILGKPFFKKYPMVFNFNDKI